MTSVLTAPRIWQNPRLAAKNAALRFSNRQIGKCALNRSDRNIRESRSRSPAPAPKKAKGTPCGANLDAVLGALPPHVKKSWGDVAADGANAFLNPVAAQRNLRQGGADDLQRKTGHFIPADADISNLAVGVYMNQAGFTLNETVGMSELYLVSPRISLGKLGHFGSGRPDLVPVDLPNWITGWTAGT